MVGRRSAATARLLSTCVVTMAYSSLFVLAALQPALAQVTGMDVRRLGFVSAAFYLTAALLSIWGGRLVARHGAVRMSVVSLTLSAAAFLVLAVANVMSAVYGAMVFGGAAVSLCMPASNALMAWAGGGRHTGLQFGIRQAAIPAGSLIAGLTAGAVGLGGPWRETAVALAATSLAMAVGALVFRARAGDSVATIHGSHETVTTPEQGPIDNLLTRRVVVASFTGGLSGAVIPGFFVVALIEWGHTLAEASGLLVLASFAGVAARVGWGRFTDWRSMSPMTALAGLMLAGGLAAALFPFLARGATPTLAVSLLFTTAMGYGGVFNHVLVLVSGLEAARFSGFQMVFVHAGGVLGPLLYSVGLTVGLSHTGCWLLTGLLMVVAGVALRGVAGRIETAQLSRT